MIVKKPDSLLILLFCPPCLKQTNTSLLWHTRICNTNRGVDVSSLIEKYAPKHGAGLFMLHAFTRYDRSITLKVWASSKTLKKIKSMYFVVFVSVRLLKYWEVTQNLAKQLEVFRVPCMVAPELPKKICCVTFVMQKISGLVKNKKKCGLGKLASMLEKSITHLLLGIWKQADISQP